MAAYALRDGEGTILVDPLVAGETVPPSARYVVARRPTAACARTRSDEPRTAAVEQVVAVLERAY